MNYSDTIIISPSGNFYGSEQVLFDFLTHTNNAYRVYVPHHGRFVEKLVLQGKHKILPFANVKLLYVKIFLLLATGKVKNIYCNEGAHIRYTKVLARFFKRSRFINHLRIVEDTNSARIGRLPPNIALICISRYIAGFLPQYKPPVIETFYDPYISTGNVDHIRATDSNPLKAGIIGRISKTKGLANIEAFCDYLESNAANNLELHLIGDADKNNEEVSRLIEKSKGYQHVKVMFRGFIENKKDLYSSIDIVLHFSETEPLGRIFFEALDYGLPVIGFQAAGIGELAGELLIEDCMVSKKSGWQRDLLNKILNIKTSMSKYQAAKEILETRFSVAAYCRSLEEIIL